MVDPQADRAMLGSVVLLVPLERRVILERMVPLVPTVPQVLRVWLVSVVLWVCLDSAVREVSPACLDHLVSLVSRELLAGVETADRPDLLDPLD